MPRLPEGGCGAAASPRGVTSPRGVNAGGDGVHSPRRTVDDPGTRSPGVTPTFALGGRSEGGAHRYGPSGTPTRLGVGRPLEVMTEALTADSFGEFAEQPFVNPLLQVVLRPHFGRPDLCRRVPVRGTGEAHGMTGAAGCPISHARRAGHDCHSLPLLGSASDSGENRACADVSGSLPEPPALSVSRQY